MPPYQLALLLYRTMVLVFPALALLKLGNGLSGWEAPELANLGVALAHLGNGAMLAGAAIALGMVTVECLLAHARIERMRDFYERGVYPLTDAPMLWWNRRGRR